MSYSILNLSSSASLAPPASAAAVASKPDSRMADLRLRMWREYALSEVQPVLWLSASSQHSRLPAHLPALTEQGMQLVNQGKFAEAITNLTGKELFFRDSLAHSITVSSFSCFWDTVMFTFKLRCSHLAYDVHIHLTKSHLIYNVHI